MYQQMCDILKVSGSVYLGEQAENCWLELVYMEWSNISIQLVKFTFYMLVLNFIMCRESWITIAREQNLNTLTSKESQPRKWVHWLSFMNSFDCYWFMVVQYTVT